MSRSRTRQDRWTNQIVTLAETVAIAVQSKDRYASSARLAHVLTRVLDSGSDHPIQRAVEALDARHAHDAADIVLLTAGGAAGTLDVALSGPGNIAGVASLFLVPLLMAAPAPAPVSRAFPAGSVREGLVRSLKDSGLVSEESMVVCHSGLYTLADLPRSWVEQRQWLRVLVDGIRRKEPALPAPAPGEPPSTEASVDSAHQLRFLVGAVLSANDEPPLWDADDSEAPEAQDRFDAWLESAAGLFQEALGLDGILVGHPDRWDDAIDAGETLWNMAEASRAIEWHCTNAGCTPDAVLADVRWRGGEDGAWVVSLTSLDHISPPWAWRPTYNPEDDRDTLLETLRSRGIRRIAVDERGVP